MWLTQQLMTKLCQKLVKENTDILLTLWAGLWTLFSIKFGFHSYSQHWQLPHPRSKGRPQTPPSHEEKQFSPGGARGLGTRLTLSMNNVTNLEREILSKSRELIIGVSSLHVVKLSLLDQLRSRCSYNYSHVARLSGLHYNWARGHTTIGTVKFSGLI